MDGKPTTAPVKRAYDDAVTITYRKRTMTIPDFALEDIALIAREQLERQRAQLSGLTSGGTEIARLLETNGLLTGHARELWCFLNEVIHGTP